MTTSNKMRALNRLPFDFEDGLKISGVDVTQLKELSTSAGASKVGYTPAGGVATTVQDKLREFVSVKDFGAVGDGVTDDTEAIQAAATYCNTTHNSLFIPIGEYLISNSVVFQNVSVYGESAVFSKIRVAASFTSDYAFIWYKAGSPITGIAVRDFVIDSQGNSGGFAMYRLYDSCVLSNLAAYNAKANKSAFRIYGYDTSDGSPVSIGQTLYAENLIGNHSDGAATSPTFDLNRMQEATLVNIKFWAGKGSTKAATQAVRIDDCRSITLISPSFATSSTYAFKVQSTGRTTRNVVVVNPLYENVDSYLHVAGTASFSAINVVQSSPRYESPVSGNYLVEYGNSVNLEVGSQPITVASTSVGTRVVADLISQITDNSTTTTAFANRNAVNTSYKIYGGVSVNKSSGPDFSFEVPGRSDKWTHTWDASTSADYGYKINYFNGSATKIVYQISRTGNQHQFRDAVADNVLFQVNAPSAGTVSMYALHNDGTTTTLKQVLAGAADSAGAGFRSLLIAN